jgi:AcrR family transcriptional regulator
MTVKGIDRRIQRTRALLLNALLDLIVERGYEDITVQDIADRANVGRSTFYAHFLDKRELLLSGVNGLHELLLHERAQLAESHSPQDRLLGFSLPLLQHVQSNLRFCRALLGPRSGAIVEPYVQRVLADLVRTEIVAQIPAGTKLTMPIDTIVQYTASAFLGLLRWWMDQPTPCVAEELDRHFQALTMPGIAAALEQRTRVH